MNFKEMASKIGVDEVDFKELLEMMVDVSIVDINNFETELAVGNYLGSAMAAHSIKGAAGNLGLTDIFTVAAELEKAAKMSDQSQMAEKIAFLKQQLKTLSEELSKKS